MSISAPEASIVDVGTTDEHLVVSLDDGRQLRTPLSWYPRLLDASPEERDRWELLAGGEAVSWPSVDEDLSLAGMLAGVPAPGFDPGPRTPAELAERQAVEATRDFYGKSLGHVKATLLQTRSQLEELLAQLPGSTPSHERVRNLANSLEPVLETVDDAAYATGTEDAMDAAGEATTGASPTDAGPQTPARAADQQTAGPGLAGEQEVVGEQQVGEQEIVDQSGGAQDAATAGTYR